MSTDNNGNYHKMADDTSSFSDRSSTDAEVKPLLTHDKSISISNVEFSTIPKNDNNPIGQVIKLFKDDFENSNIKEESKISVNNSESTMDTSDNKDNKNESTLVFPASTNYTGTKNTTLYNVNSDKNTENNNMKEYLSNLLQFSSVGFDKMEFTDDYEYPTILPPDNLNQLTHIKKCVDEKKITNNFFSKYPALFDIELHKFNAVIVGGSITKHMINDTESSPVVKICFYKDYYDPYQNKNFPTDINTLSETVLKKKLFELISLIGNNLNASLNRNSRVATKFDISPHKNIFMTSSSNALIVNYADYLKVAFDLQIHKSIDDAVDSSGIDCTNIAIINVKNTISKILVNNRFINSLKNMVNVVNLEKRDRHFERRLNKYLHLGFSIGLPNFNIQNIETIPDTKTRINLGNNNSNKLSIVLIDNSLTVASSCNIKDLQLKEIVGKYDAYKYGDKDFALSFAPYHQIYEHEFDIINLTKKEHPSNSFDNDKIMVGDISKLMIGYNFLALINNTPITFFKKPDESFQAYLFRNHIEETYKGLIDNFIKTANNILNKYPNLEPKHCVNIFLASTVDDRKKYFNGLVKIDQLYDNIKYYFSSKLEFIKNGDPTNQTPEQGLTDFLNKLYNILIIRLNINNDSFNNNKMFNIHNTQYNFYKNISPNEWYGKYYLDTTKINKPTATSNNSNKIDNILNTI